SSDVCSSDLRKPNPIPTTRSPALPVAALTSTALSALPARAERIRWTIILARLLPRAHLPALADGTRQPPGWRFRRLGTELQSKSPIHRFPRQHILHVIQHRPRLPVRPDPGRPHLPELLVPHGHDNRVVFALPR